MASKVAVWAASGAAIAAIGYDVPQLLQVFGVLGEPWDRILIFGSSLLLAPLYVLAIAATHAVAPAGQRVWSLSALAMAILYAADVSQIYIVQLGAVLPHDLHGEPSETAFAACCLGHMPATAIDLLGYTFMSLSTLLLAPVFAPIGLGRWLRMALIANGLLGVVIIAQLKWHWLIYLASPWMITFPAAMILLALTLSRPDSAGMQAKPAPTRHS